MAAHRSLSLSYYTAPELSFLELLEVAARGGCRQVGVRLLDGAPDAAATPLLQSAALRREARRRMAALGLTALEASAARIRPATRVTDFEPFLAACAELGVSESRFHELRSEWLQQSLAPLEPKPLGRPKPVMTPEQAQIEELKALVERLSKELARSQIKEELALSMPQLFLRSNRNEPPIETAKKKTLAKYFRAARLNASNASGNSKESSA